MAKYRLLIIICAVGFVGVNGDNLSDFTNNLATDIGPLLVLFGESMTTQYLSESTSFLDYFIFAMAPIGILTAIVSAIRVCGHSSLRAFIGRSQEGDAVVEAELCTSTSRDVCELFNRGGITRVLGRPNILELLYVPRYGNLASHDHRADKTGLFLFRNYLETHKDPDTSDWKKVESSAFWRASYKTTESSPFAPKPNLSLNVGIVKQPNWVFLGVAAIAAFLQAGVLVLAGIGVWVLQWNVNQGDTSSSSYAPVMFIVGTFLMCTGMWSCAALIGQSTYEVSYERSQSPSSSRLLWLQPGPQTIGDQSFDPFAYFEKRGKPLGVWTSSKKDFNDRFEFYTFFAVLFTLTGYIMQFIGLRGMKAWVSLTQLGITVIVSILRGLLRIQRLNRNDNKLERMPDMIVGHELDWLAFELAQQESQQGSFWHVTSHRQKKVSTSGSESYETSSQDDSDLQCIQCDTKDQGATTSRSGSLATPRVAQDGLVVCRELLPIRVRLAHLTGHHSFINIEDREYQMWKDDRVKVRTEARKLSAAVCLAAGSLFRKSRPKRDITLRIEAFNSPNGDWATCHEQLISVILRPPSDSSQAGWEIDSARMEAILGLWMWSLVSDRRLESKDESRHKISRAEKITMARIVSAGLDNYSWDRKINRQSEMDVWLGPNEVKLSEAHLTLDKHDNYGLISLWTKPTPGAGGDWKALPKEVQSDKSQSDRSPPNLQRFCGWNPVYESLRSEALDLANLATANISGQQLDQEVKLRVQYVSVNNSLLGICTQELFAALTGSLVSQLVIGEANTVDSADEFWLDNKVRVLAKAFVETGLGSYSDAIFCIVPAFGNQLHGFTPEAMLSALIKGAETYRQESEWERAEVLLRWACKCYCLPHSEEAQSTSNSGDFIVRALRATGELYRWSLAQNSNGERKGFGTGGVEWMDKTYRSANHSNPEVTEILDCYKDIAERIVESPQVRNPRHDADGIQGVTRTQDLLLQAIRERKRVEALYQLCFITIGGFGSDYSQAALPLAVRNNWNEVVDAILEMKANPNGKDENGRTAISYCAEYGYWPYLKPFIDRGAFLDLPDRDRRTPLLWAAQTGHANVTMLLLEKGANIEAEDICNRTPLSHAAQNGHGATVKILLERGANIEAQGDGLTPLSHAAETGRANIAMLLLEKGANIEVGGTARRGPLSYASQNGHVATVKILLARGANVEAQEHGLTPLSRAAQNGHEAVVKLMLEKGAKIEANQEGLWPLLYAVQNGHEAVVKVLFEHGSDIEQGDDIKPKDMDHATSFDGPITPDIWIKKLSGFKQFISNIPGLKEKPSVKVSLIDDGAKLARLPGKQEGLSFRPDNEDYFVGPCSSGTLMAWCIRQVCPMAELFIARLDDSRTAENQKFTIASAHKALKWAMDMDADIISMSWAFSKTGAENDKDKKEFFTLIEKAVKSKKVILFGSLPDMDPFAKTSQYAPVGCSGVIKIGSATFQGQAKAQNGCGNPDFLFPGERLMTTAGEVVSGCSFSTAYASGLAALVLYCLRAHMNLEEPHVMDGNPDPEDDRAKRLKIAKTIDGMKIIFNILSQKEPYPEGKGNSFVQPYFIFGEKFGDSREEKLKAVERVATSILPPKALDICGGL